MSTVGRLELRSGLRLEGCSGGGRRGRIREKEEERAKLRRHSSNYEDLLDYRHDLNEKMYLKLVKILPINFYLFLINFCTT